MKNSFLFFSLTIFFLSCATKVPEPLPQGLNIVELTPNKWTSITKQNIIHLVQVYDLTPFLFTKTIHIQSQVVPHSHPILTLNSRNAENPKKILSTWLHEELHWWTSNNNKNVELAIEEFKKVYPSAPVTSSLGLDSTYLHLIICHLELKALAYYLGEEEARTIISDIMKKDKIYPWIYFQVLNKDFIIKKIVKKYKLYPPPLT